MKNNKFLKIAFIAFCINFCILETALCQIDSASVISKIMTPGHVISSTDKAVKGNTGVIPFTLSSNEIRIFPSANPQSEIHLSVNKTNPQVLLLSSNTQVTNSNQGAWWSTNGGSTWVGAETTIIPGLIYHLGKTQF